MLKGGRQRVGSEVAVFDGGAQVMRGQVVSPVFFDPSGERMDA
jgi:hypothetical protein